jgi:hypothetical protein
MPPRNGVRFTLRLRSEKPVVVYGFAAEAHDQRHEGQVRVTPRDGGVEFQDCDGLPEPISKAMRALLRSLWRPRSQNETPWPRRLQRWRDLSPADER